MNVIETDLPGVLILEPKVFGDERGFFMESWNGRRYEGLGIPNNFVQDNLSFSARGFLRGLHFQNPRAQGKLVSVLRGEVFDVAVDIRTGSPTFGRWTGVTLSAENRRQFWVPPDFAHGFVVTGEGRLDRQTLAGKAVFEVATRCRQAGVACHAVVGTAELEPFEARILDLSTIAEATTSEELEQAGRELGAGH